MKYLRVNQCITAIHPVQVALHLASRRGQMLELHQVHGSCFRCVPGFHPQRVPIGRTQCLPKPYRELARGLITSKGFPPFFLKEIAICGINQSENVFSQIIFALPAEKFGRGWIDVLDDRFLIQQKEGSIRFLEKMFK